MGAAKHMTRTQYLEIQECLTEIVDAAGKRRALKEALNALWNEAEALRNEKATHES
jgi:hypothetical protein